MELFSWIFCKYFIEGSMSLIYFLKLTSNWLTLSAWSRKTPILSKFILLLPRFCLCKKKRFLIMRIVKILMSYYLHVILYSLFDTFKVVQIFYITRLRSFKATQNIDKSLCLPLTDFQWSHNIQNILLIFSDNVYICFVTFFLQLQTVINISNALKCIGWFFHWNKISIKIMYIIRQSKEQCWKQIVWWCKGGFLKVQSLAPFGHIGCGLG